MPNIDVIADPDNKRVRCRQRQPDHSRERHGCAGIRQPGGFRVTQEKAAEILTDYLKTLEISKENDPDLTIAYDRTDEANGQKYYVFHVFDDKAENTATLGWYGVQINDGSLYDFLLMEVIDSAA